MDTANQLANKWNTSCCNILVAASLLLREMRAPNSTNKHSTWYAYHFLQEKGGQYLSILLFVLLHCSLSFIVSQEAYQHMIPGDYRQWIFGKTEEEKAENMKEIWDWVDNNGFKSGNTTSYKSVTARMIGTWSQLTKLVRFFHNFSLFINLLFQCQTIENLDEITIISAIIYCRLYPAGKQLPGIFTSSPRFQKLINGNNTDIWKVLDCLTLHSSKLQWNYIMP